MAANFAFRPYGLSQSVTVVGSAGTLSFAVVNMGGSTMTVGSSNVQPQAVRVVNMGTVAASLQFNGSSSCTIGLSTGMPVLPLTDRVFRAAGTQFMSYISSGTTTLVMTFGEGQ